MFVAHAGEKTADARARRVLHGDQRERTVFTGVGAILVKVPRLRDRGTSDDKITFAPSILPRYPREVYAAKEQRG